MGLLAGIYNGLFKRTSTFALCIGVGVIGVSTKDISIYLKFNKKILILYFN